MEFHELIGLTKKEYTLFELLNEFGDQSATELIKQSTIPSSKIYFHLDTLIRKGIITANQGKKHRVYHAQHPNALKELYIKQIEKLQSQEALVNTQVELHDKKRLTKEKYLTIETYHGIKGIMSFYDKIIRIGKAGEVMRMAGSVKLNSPTLKGYFRQFHKKRAEKRIELFALKEKHLPKVIEKFEHTHIAYIERKTPTVYIIFRDYLAIVLSNVQPTAIVIRNEDLATSFKAYFEELFDQKKE